MARVTASLLLFIYTDFFIESLPIKNGFSIKLKPLSKKYEYHPKTFSSLFAKISQDYTPEAILRQQIFAKLVPPPPPMLGTGCSNQVARMKVLPIAHANQGANRTLIWEAPEYINLPIIKQPFKDYKVLVATAPPDIKIGRGENSTNVVIYVLFNEESSGEDTKDEMVMAPEIYFVNKQHESYSVISKVTSEPNSVILVDSNRTVTGLKSKQVEKFIKFRNRLLKDYLYDVSP